MLARQVNYIAIFFRLKWFEDLALVVVVMWKGWGDDFILFGINYLSFSEIGEPQLIFNVLVDDFIQFVYFFGRSDKLLESKVAIGFYFFREHHAFLFSPGYPDFIIKRGTDTEVIGFLVEWVFIFGEGDKIQLIAFLSHLQKLYLFTIC